MNRFLACVAAVCLPLALHAQPPANVDTARVLRANQIGRAHV